MSKDEFLIQLQDNGYEAGMSENIPTVYTEDMGIVKNISGLVKSLGYSYSYAVRLKSKKE